jgi:hypothetical protein
MNCSGVRRTPGAVPVEGRRLAAIQAVRTRAPGRCLNCVPAFGPVVVIVRVTSVAGNPAASDAGLKVQPVRAGRLAHPKLTAEPKESSPTGAAKNE